MYRRLGGDVIGMTGLPEAVLAREAGICLASLAIVSNLGAGLADGSVAQADHARTVGELGGVVGPLLRRAAVAGASSTRACGCGALPQAPPPPGDPGGEPFAGDADEDGELTLVLLRPSVLGDRQVGRAISVLEKVAALRAVKSVMLDAHAIDAIYDRPGIANLLPGIRNAHVGLPAVALALCGSPGTCVAVEREVEKVRAVVARDALHNGVHASGDPQAARRELALFFAPDELVGPGHRERRTEHCGVA
jgi:nucleoside diphosphate kinase